MFDINFKKLNERFPEIASDILNSDCGNISVFDTRDGGKVPQVQINDKKFFIHSKFNPSKEADRQVSEILTKDFDLYIVFGFGFAYHIEKLLDSIPSSSNILVIDRDFSLIKSALENRDLVHLFSDQRFNILVNPTDDQLAAILRGKSSKSVTMFTHRGSYQVDPEFYNNSLRLVKSYLSTKEVNIATLSKFEKTWSANIARNIKTFVENPGINIFYDKFSDIDAVVVAAGPSLSDSIDFLKENCNKLVVIAVDTSFLFLKKHGIIPHFCLSVDPQFTNARYFSGDTYSKTIVASDPTVHPSVFKLCKSRVACAGVAFDMMKWIENITGPKGEITHGGSVSTNAYDFAKRLGFRKIYLVGQDLSFTQGLAHVKGSYLDEQIHNVVYRFKNAQMFNRNQLKALPGIFIKGIKTNRVYTNQKMIIFLNWFQKQNNDRLVNLTVDGAFIENVNHSSISDIKIEEPSFSIDEYINKIYNENLKSIDENVKINLLKQIIQIKKEIINLIEKLERAVVVSKNLCELIESGNKDVNKTSYILNKLSDIDRYIQSITTAKDVIGLTAQRVIHSITEGYNFDDIESKDLQVAKKSLFLYEGLLEGAVFNLKSFNKMEKIFVDK